MARSANKKSTPKKKTKKPAAGKAAKKPVAAKAAAKAPARSSKEPSGATPYTPRPIEGVGWPAFRYPPA